MEQNPIDASDKRAAAREKARKLQQQADKKQKLKRAGIQSSIAIGALALLGGVALIISSIGPSVGPGPENMASGGIVIGQGFAAERTEAFASNEAPTPTLLGSDSPPLVSIFVDYSCPACAGFDEYYGEFLTSAVTNGDILLEYQIVAFRDPASGSYRYSTRSGNAAACVADLSPDNFYRYSRLLYTNQPGELDTPSLDDSTLIALAEQAGIRNLGEVESCIKEERFASWLESATERAMQTGPLPIMNASAEIIQGTPSVFINGVEYRGQTVEDLQAAIEAARS